MTVTDMGFWYVTVLAALAITVVVLTVRAAMAPAPHVYVCVIYDGVEKVVCR